ncbi:hypothetical protein BXY82_0899 [Gelidibacter sediminis]|uniref:GIY-YIG domain-containing protein n=1 Tax=Gelidibacter sediminis TaxID=1608710 RepID=A0A4R7Q777_9FLAO|nr:hypothetical protein BXY82_0899 [Gelidibacter sediminis]
MNKNEYYVYGLIDPRNDQYFYIGKGKGKRYLSHLKPTKNDLNFSKLERIQKIKDSNLEVKIEILFPNLDEDTAFELERIIIYKLGRQVLNEGILSNLNPGGKWRLKDSIFYPKAYQPKFELNKLDFIAQQKFQEIPTLSQFNYLNTPNKEQKIYTYNKNGSFKCEETLDEFFSDGINKRQIELFKAIRENNFPVYSNWIYSKQFFEKLYVSDKIPFAQYDIIDEQFNLNFDKEFEKSLKFNLKSNINGVLRMSVERNNNTITLTSYYPSGNKKYFKKTKKGKPFKITCEWYENGNLSVKEELKDSHNEYIRTTYYENGNKESKISTLKENRSYERWFPNGVKEVEFIEGIGYVHYDEQGIKTRIEGLNNVSYYKKNQLTLDVFENIEISKEIKTEEEQSDLDWYNYQQEIDKLNEF